ncbi:MAG: DUF2953 domain-containing protein [Oscillospiraceae bacterium]|nr:DUF2953 domain-containing protein [Oscillospiraceae bacterium]
MGWIIALGVVILLAILPLGVRIRYNSDGMLVKVIAGPLKITVFPLPKKQKKEKKKKSSPKQVEQQEEENLPQPPQPPKKKKEKKPKEEKGGSLTDFLPFVKLALDFLNDFRKKLRIDHLELKLILAADDPCDLAVNYGRTWAAVGNLMTALDRVLVIGKRNIEVECDFTASQTLVIAGLDLTITLGRLLSMVGTVAVRGLKEFLIFKKKRKGGAVK